MLGDCDRDWYLFESGGSGPDCCSELGTWKLAGVTYKMTCKGGLITWDRAGRHDSTGKGGVKYVPR